jgi:hypothetical protein
VGENRTSGPGTVSLVDRKQEKFLGLEREKRGRQRAITAMCHQVGGFIFIFILSPRQTGMFPVLKSQCALTLVPTGTFSTYARTA